MLFDPARIAAASPHQIENQAEDRNQQNYGDPCNFIRRVLMVEHDPDHGDGSHNLKNNIRGKHKRFHFI